MKSGSFRYLAPGSLAEALQFISEAEHAAPYAGGTDLVPKLRAPLEHPLAVIDLKRIDGLDYLRRSEDDTRLEIGALVTHAELARSSILHGPLAALSQAAGRIGSVQVRNRGTIGGNVCAGVATFDYPTILAALRAELRLVSLEGTRRMPFEDGFSYGDSNLKAGELLLGIDVPVPSEDSVATYRKFQRSALEPTLVGLALMVRRVDQGLNVRAASGNYSDRPVVVDLTFEQAPEAERLSHELFARISQIEAKDDIRASGGYRSHVLKVLLARTITEILPLTGVRR